MNDLSATDRCVKCGLCLPHCPTFALTENEADSPRGRISLIQALDQPEPPVSPGLFRHLDRCLQCGACEAMCPSRVPFGELMDSARAVMEPYRERSVVVRTLRSSALWLLTSPRLIRALGQVLRLYQRLGLQRLVASIPLLPSRIRRLNRLLPEIHGTQVKPAEPSSEKQGAVNLFTGCIASVFDRQTLGAAQRLLQRLGYRVNVPSQQTCCGALHQHTGEPETASRLAAVNRGAFAANRDPILVTASGCAAHLRDYASPYDKQSADSFAGRVSDILHFLATHHLETMQFAPLAEQVAVHIPCTHRNALKQHQDILDLLQRIPDLDAVIINPDGGCCGAAGSYMLTQPEIAGRLREPMVEKATLSGTKILLTTNIGCSIQLQAGLKEAAHDIEVLHPVSLLDRLLITTDSQQ